MQEVEKTEYSDQWVFEMLGFLLVYQNVNFLHKQFFSSRRSDDVEFFFRIVCFKNQSATGTLHWKKNLNYVHPTKKKTEQVVASRLSLQ